MTRTNLTPSARATASAFAFAFAVAWRSAYALSLFPRRRPRACPRAPRRLFASGGEKEPLDAVCAGGGRRVDEPADVLNARHFHRSEERRVGKEWRSRWAPYHSKTAQRAQIPGQSDRDVLSAVLVSRRGEVQ